MARSLGSSLGISMISATLISNSAADHSVLADHINCGDPVLGASLPALMNPCSGGSLEALNGEVTRQAAMIGYDGIFAWMALGTLLLAAAAAADAPAAADADGGARGAGGGRMRLLQVSGTRRS